MTDEMKALEEMDPIVAAVVRAVCRFPGDTQTHARALRAALAMFDVADELLQEIRIKASRPTFQSLGRA